MTLCENKILCSLLGFLALTLVYGLRPDSGLGAAWGCPDTHHALLYSSLPLCSMPSIEEKHRLQLEASLTTASISLEFRVCLFGMQ